ncbi:hypothetical protein M419DRAFT_92680, partial [Trichoderma reesei RUT C-30]
RLRSRPTRICAGGGGSRVRFEGRIPVRVRWRQSQESKSAQGMVRESALVQAEGGARWADSSLNEHATNAQSVKLGQKAEREEKRYGQRAGKGRLSSTGVSGGGQLGVWPRCRKGTRRFRLPGPFQAIGCWAVGGVEGGAGVLLGALGETQRAGTAVSRVLEPLINVLGWAGLGCEWAGIDPFNLHLDNESPSRAALLVFYLTWYCSNMLFLLPCL